MEIINPNLNIDSNFLSSLNRINTALNGSEQTDTITGGINRGQDNVYRFLKGEGLHLPSSGTTSYSLELIFKFDETNGYRKILDFAGRTQDTGLYVYNQQIRFYNVSGATGGTVNSGEYNHLILTRSNDNTVVAYLNGQQIFSFNDSSNLAVINASDGLNIFIEDTLQGTEQSAGHLDLLSFWSSNTLSSTQTLHRYNSLQDSSIAPSVNITSDRSELNSGETATITFTFSKEITDFDLNDITVTGGTISNLTGIGGTITASGENALAGEGKEEAFDRNSNTKWLTFSNTGWLQYEFETPVVVTDYHLTSANDEPARDPKDWQLQGSNDGVNFVNLESQTNQNFDTRLETKSFHIPSTNQQAYQYYRLNITANHGLDSYGDATLQLAELQLEYDSIYTATFTPEEDSQTTANIQVGSDYFDLSGNPGTSQSITIDIDTDETAPTLVITSDKSELSSGETATITFTFSEEVSGFDSSDITVTGGTLGTVSTSDNQIYTATFTPEEDSQITGTIQVGSDYFDLSGNPGTSQSITIDIDTDETAPTLTITSDKSELSSGETATITFTFSEEVSGFDSSDITVTGGTLGTVSTSDNQIYTATFTPEEDSQITGTIQVGSDYFDLSGNLGTSQSITIDIDTDGTAPTLIITSDKSELSSGETATITFTFSEEVSEFDSSDITVTGGTLGTVSTSDNQIYTATFTPEEDSQITGTIQVGSDYFDLSGNLGTSQSITIDIDT
ncbi:MAG: hypothetical protein F6K45_07885, partial [Kamptonema sp. SIO1D9]|nr:hypothetical protein [Kamptonema sp. SIO1D9]